LLQIYKLFAEKQKFRGEIAKKKEKDEYFGFLDEYLLVSNYYFGHFFFFTVLFFRFFGVFVCKKY
jgi:hypothetical protein